MLHIFGNFSPENCDVSEVEVGRAEQKKHSIQITLRVKRATPLLAPRTSVAVLEIAGDSPTLSKHDNDYEEYKAV